MQMHWRNLVHAELILQVAYKIWMISCYIFISKPEDMYELEQQKRCFSSHSTHSVCRARRKERKAPDACQHHVLVVSYMHVTSIACAHVCGCGVHGSFFPLHYLNASVLWEQEDEEGASSDVSWGLLSELCMLLWELIHTAAKHTYTLGERKKEENSTCKSQRPDSKARRAAAPRAECCCLHS